MSNNIIEYITTILPVDNIEYTDYGTTIVTIGRMTMDINETWLTISYLDEPVLSYLLTSEDDLYQFLNKITVLCG